MNIKELISLLFFLVLSGWDLHWLTLVLQTSGAVDSTQWKIM